MGKKNYLPFSFSFSQEVNISIKLQDIKMHKFIYLFYAILGKAQGNFKTKKFKIYWREKFNTVKFTF